MHSKIFSERERKLLKQLIENGAVKDETFRMLKMRIKRNYPCIVEDFKLITKVKDKL